MSELKGMVTKDWEKKNFGRFGMTRDDMIKTSFKPYQAILYKDARMPEPVEAMLCGIDFDAELMYLAFDKGSAWETKYSDGVFHANIQHCEIKKKEKLKLVNAVKSY